MIKFYPNNLELMMKDHLEQKEVVKVVIIGSTKSGKTHLRNSLRLESYSFSKDYVPTLGIDFSQLERPNKKIRIWEMAGNPMLALTGCSYFRGTDLLLLCVDLSKEIDRQELKNYLARVREYEKNCPIVLVGTKRDKALEENIAQFNGLDLSDDKIIRRIMTSVRTGENIASLQNQLFKKIVDPNYEMSEWTKAFAQLQKGLMGLSESKKIYVQSAVASLVSAIQQKHLNPEVKLDLITRTLISVHKKIDEIEHPVLKALAVIAAIAVVAVVVGLIGYVCGLAVGAWTGPGAFFTALTAGTMAAASVVAVAIGLGLGAGGGLAYGFFKKPDNVVEHGALSAYSKNIEELATAPMEQP